MRQTKSQNELTWRTQPAQAEADDLLNEAQLCEATNEDYEATDLKKDDLIC